MTPAFDDSLLLNPDTEEGITWWDRASIPARTHYGYMEVEELQKEDFYILLFIFLSLESITFVYDL